MNVVTVLAFGCTPVGEATHGLGFARYPADVYRADAFRKIPQQADRAAAEPGFAEFLARVVPGVSIRR